MKIRNNEKPILRFTGYKLSKQKRNKIIFQNTKLVNGIINKYYFTFCNNIIQIDDLQSVGTFGLIKGIEKFEYKKGSNLKVYLYRWIRIFIDRYISKFKNSINLPISTKEKHNIFEFISVEKQEEQTSYNLQEEEAILFDTKYANYLNNKFKKNKITQTTINLIENSLINFPIRERLIFKLKYLEKYTDKELCKLFYSKRPDIRKIIKNCKNKIQEFIKQNNIKHEELIGS